jgi:DNA-binding XRE family transcriptional regulator
MYIHSFRLIAPHKLLEAQLFNQRYHSYEEIKEVPDRLRWCRHHMGLMQKEVAAQIGVNRGYYVRLEAGDLEYYPKEIVDKLAAFYLVPVDDLLDDYNRFLYYGQGRLIQKHRQSLELKKKPYARLMKIGIRSLQKWESNSKQISKKSWEKYFKGVIKV